MKEIVNAKLNQVNFLDERYYEVRKDVFYPSVTYVLDNAFPKGAAFLQWVKDVGNNAKAVAERAAAAGTLVHNTIEKMIAGLEIVWDDKVFGLAEWQGVLRFVEFYEKFVQRVWACEIKVYSDKYKYAGTVDFVCSINGQNWLIDFKFGNAIYESYFLQICAYKQAWNEMNAQVKIDRTGILHLKAATRTEGKGDVIQGNGWQLKESPRTYEQDWAVFQSVLNVHNFLEPVPKPKNLIYPASIKITDKKQQA